ncbi:gamma-aminobutyrate permease, partial [Staphylococcus pseudintermedius]
IAFLLMVLVAMLINNETRVSVIIGFLFLGFMDVFFFLRGYHKRDKEDFKL